MNSTYFPQHSLELSENVWLCEETALVTGGGCGAQSHLRVFVPGCIQSHIGMSQGMTNEDEDQDEDTLRETTLTVHPSPPPPFFSFRRGERREKSSNAHGALPAAAG